MGTGRGEKGEGEMYGESNTEIYSTICKVDSQQEFAVWPRELKQGLCDNLEGWDGEGDGGRFKEEVQKGGETGVPMAGSIDMPLYRMYDILCWYMTKTTKFCKAIILQLKK